MIDPVDVAESFFGTPMGPKDLLAPADFKAHWRDDVDDLIYHADRTAIGSTSLRKALQSPKAFYWDVFKNVKEDKKEFKYGKMIHEALLDGEKFQGRYIIEPEFWGRTLDGKQSKQSKEAKEKRAMWLADLPPGKLVVTEKERTEIIEIVGSVKEHEDATLLLSNGVAERAGYFRDAETGLRLKIKPDFLSFDITRLTDVKTTRDAQKNKFGSSAAGYRYDVQLYMYAEGVRAITGKFPEIISILALEKVAPFECACYHIRIDQLDQARLDYRKALTRIREGIDSDKWPMRQTQMEPLHTPTWFINEIVDEESGAI